jgi:adenylate cyclase
MTSQGPGVRGIRAPTDRSVRRQLQRVLESPDFDASRRSREFLGFIVEEALRGRGHDLTQLKIATRVFGRKDDFDPVVDPIVRIQAGRLRRSLERYYLLSGRQDALRIELPKGTYVPVFSASGAAESTPGMREAGANVLHDGWPSVVVGEFEVVGPGPDNEELTAEMTEELALELGRYRAVRVLQQRDQDGLGPFSRERVRFVLGGRVRRDGEDLRVTARLVDRMSGEQVWGDEYHTAPRPGQWSGTPDDVARVIAARVGAEEGVIVQILAGERRKREAVAPTSYDAILRSYDFFFARDPETFVPALEALRQVVSAEPECGLAWTRLARLYTANYTFEVAPIPTPLDDAITYAQTGVRVDASSRSARCVLALALLIKGELAAGRDELEEALRSSPGSLVYLEIVGYLLTLLGDWERGPALSRSALERNPHCMFHVRFGIWADCLRRGEIELAYQAALEYRDPSFFMRSVMRASCLGLLGRAAEARTEVAELLSRKPDFPRRGRALIGYLIKFPEVMSRIDEGLARAGLRLA